MSTPIPSNTNLSLQESNGRHLLQTSIDDYISFLKKQPTFCGTPEQQEALINYVAQGQDLIKLVAAERLNITRQLDHQKQEWMAIEAAMTAPLLDALQPLKDAVDHYNREILRIRAHQQQVDTTISEDATNETTWLKPEIARIALPKGVQMKWVFKVIDPNQVPNGYWIIDEGAIKAAISNGVRNIPGVEIYEEAITTFRR